jgi:hypothetical protein
MLFLFYKRKEVVLQFVPMLFQLCWLVVLMLVRWCLAKSVGEMINVPPELLLLFNVVCVGLFGLDVAELMLISSGCLYV